MNFITFDNFLIKINFTKNSLRDKNINETNFPKDTPWKMKRALLYSIRFYSSISYHLITILQPIFFNSFSRVCKLRNYNFY